MVNTKYPSFELPPILKQLNSTTVITLSIYGVIPLFLLASKFAGLLRKLQGAPSSSHGCSLQAEVCHGALQKLPASPLFFFICAKKSAWFFSWCHILCQFTHLLLGTESPMESTCLPAKPEECATVAGGFIPWKCQLGLPPSAFCPESPRWLTCWAHGRDSNTVGQYLPFSAAHGEANCK